jgi:nitrite reductase (NADH) small subunit
MHSDTKWVRVTQCENIPLREGRSVTIDTHEIAIFRLGDRFFAIANTCPHRGGPLSEGIVSGNTVVCPLHAWKVDFETGSVLNQAGAVPCVRTYPTRVQKGVVQIELPVERVAKPEKLATCIAASGANNNPVSPGQACVLRP